MIEPRVASSSAGGRGHRVGGHGGRRRRRRAVGQRRSPPRRRRPPRPPRPGRSSSVTSSRRGPSRRSCHPWPAPSTCRDARPVPGRARILGVALPLTPPFKPMLAKLARTIPDGDGWLFEPKWDGFRCIVFRDGDDIELASRNERPFTRYFPELSTRCGGAAGPVRRRRRDRRRRRRRQRARLRRPAPAHPPGRVAGRRLAAETPASYVAFDLLASATTCCSTARSPSAAGCWGDPPGPAAGPPHAGEHRSGRRAEVVRALRGRRPRRRRRQAPRRPVPAGQAGAGQGQARAHGRLRRRRLPHPQGRQRRRLAAARAVRRRRPAAARRRRGVVHGQVPAELLAELEPLTHDALDDHPWRDWAEWQNSTDEARKPGATSRWNAGKDLSWVPIRVERVAEVTFGQLEKRRFRHGVSFVRWRPDRDAGELPLRPARRRRPRPLRGPRRPPVADLGAGRRRSV